MCSEAWAVVQDWRGRFADSAAFAGLEAALGADPRTLVPHSAMAFTEVSSSGSKSQ
jgi:hypothetical protein